MLAGEQFERVRRLALGVAGIELTERHRQILQHRCGRAGIEDESAMAALLDAVEQGDAIALRRLVGLITTKFTGFFRNPWHFDVAAEHALWAVHRRGAARLWSAAAATGEEPYSLAMALIEVFCPRRSVVNYGTGFAGRRRDRVVSAGGGGRGRRCGGSCS